MISPTDLSNFAASIAATDRSTELECSPYVKYAADVLVPQTPYKLIDLAQEQRSFYGRSDYIVSADLRNPTTSAVERYVVFWELKSPQAFILERDDAQNRFRPTSDFVKAETQLLHYHHQASLDQDFRARYEVLHPHNVLLGGIIIGTTKRLVKDATDAANAAHSFRIRSNVLYRSAGIKVLNWDYVYECAQRASDKSSQTVV